MAAVSDPNVGDCLELLALAQEGARIRRLRGLRWGCTISTARITQRDVVGPSDPLLGDVGLKATTLGREQLWLIPELVDALGPVVVQGECRGWVYADHSAASDEPLAELRVVLCPAPSTEHLEESMRFESAFIAGDSRILVLLAIERPPGWPP